MCFSYTYRDYNCNNIEKIVIIFIFFTKALLNQWQNMATMKLDLEFIGI